MKRTTLIMKLRAFEESRFSLFLAEAQRTQRKQISQVGLSVFSASLREHFFQPLAGSPALRGDSPFSYKKALSRKAAKAQRKNNMALF